MDDKERKRPRVIPQPDKVPLVDPILAAREMRAPGAQNITSDVDGWYTGTGAKGAAPEQDADDL
ncbi:MAG: hypothetical protein E7541_04300 [Ruminococcaceae bacterium]|nr:hypothetical protein [Oscillospiraceae bacterium]